MVTTNDEKLGTLARRVAGLGYKTLEAGQALREFFLRNFNHLIIKDTIF